jgi:small conductance mechanosensitive channel
VFTLDASLPAPASWLPFGDGKGTAEVACKEPEKKPSVLCRTVWNVTNDHDTTRFFHNWFDDLLSNLIWITITVVVALVIHRIVHKMITRVTMRMAEGTIPERVRERSRTVFDGSPALLSERRRQRAHTMDSLLRSIASIAIFGTAAFSVLGEIGINLAPFLASASIIGVAVGFGAQSLVRDFLWGALMLLEDQYGVGDIIDVGPAKGTVEAVTLRVTRLRDVNGVVWYVRNGEILRVGNESQNWARAVLDIPVSPDEDVAKVRKVMGEAATALAAEPPWDELILDEPEVWGVQALTNESVTIRLVVKTAPGKQGEVSRELRERVKKAFDEAEISFTTATA